MSNLRFICPKCGKSLHLSEASLLGRRGKCPSCFHRFTLEKPVEDELEHKSPPAESNQPARGEVPNFEAWPKPAGEEVPSADPPLIVDSREEPYALRQWRRRKRRAARRRVAALVVLCLIGLICAGLYFVSDRIDLPFGPKTGATDAVKQEPHSGTHEDDSFADVPPVILPANDEAVNTGKDDSIPLLLVPSGARIVIHLHPADIWNSSDPARELQECLGPLASWAEECLKNLSLFEPVEIDEVTICIMLGSPERSPDVCAVVRLNGEVKRSDLLARFDGRRVDDYGFPVYLSAQSAYLIHDLKTFAVVPRALAAEMVAGRDAPNPTDPEMESLMRSTDRTRHLTVAFSPDDVLLHREMLVPESLQDLLVDVAGWLNPDKVECAAWSIHDERLADTPLLAQKPVSERKNAPLSHVVSQRGADRSNANAGLTSTLLLRSRATVPERRLAREMHAKLDGLAGEMLRKLSAFEPPETGRRRVIGRLPAMLQVVSLSAHASAADRFVRLSTSLPERAAPNLALAARLAWEESQRNPASSRRGDAVNR